MSSKKDSISSWRERKKVTRSFRKKGSLQVVKKTLKGIEYALYIVLLILVLIFVVSVIQEGLFESIESIQTVIQKTGAWGALLFVLFQITQVVIPGGVVNASGVILYGPWRGFLLNLVGNMTGGLIAFLLARRFGIKLVSIFFDEVHINRFQNKFEDSDYVPVFLAITVALPGVPDGALVYLTGIVTNMSVTKFMLIMLVGRGLSLLAYSIGIDNILRLLENILDAL